MEELIKEINYKEEYKKLKEAEKENQELKETIISMSKFMFSRDNALVETIKNIDKSLKTISRRK